jgi:hypothetical protein
MFESSEMLKDDQQSTVGVIAEEGGSERATAAAEVIPPEQGITPADGEAAGGRAPPRAGEKPRKAADPVEVKLRVVLEKYSDVQKLEKHTTKAYAQLGEAISSYLKACIGEETDAGARKEKRSKAVEELAEELHVDTHDINRWIKLGGLVECLGKRVLNLSFRLALEFLPTIKREAKTEKIELVDPENKNALLELLAAAAAKKLTPTALRAGVKNILGKNASASTGRARNDSRGAPAQEPGGKSANDYAVAMHKQIDLLSRNPGLADAAFQSLGRLLHNQEVGLDFIVKVVRGYAQAARDERSEAAKREFGVFIVKMHAIKKELSEGQTPDQKDKDSAA